MKRRHLCDVPGCGRTRERWQRICGACYAALPGSIRYAIIDAHRMGNRGEWRKARKAAGQHLAAPRPAAPPPPNPSPRLTAEQAFELNQRQLGER